MWEEYDFDEFYLDYVGIYWDSVHAISMEIDWLQTKNAVIGWLPIKKNVIIVVILLHDSDHSYRSS